MLLDPPVIMDWSLQIAGGMNYLHEVGGGNSAVGRYFYFMIFYFSFAHSYSVLGWLTRAGAHGAGQEAPIAVVHRSGPGRWLFFNTF